jgi:hypothetical protein
MIGPVQRHPYEALIATETNEQRMTRIMANRHLLFRPEAIGCAEGGEPESDQEDGDDGSMTTVGECARETLGVKP